MLFLLHSAKKPFSIVTRVDYSKCLAKYSFLCFDNTFMVHSASKPQWGMLDFAFPAKQFSELMKIFCKFMKIYFNSISMPESEQRKVERGGFGMSSLDFAFPAECS